ncbi:transmembrane protein 45B [Xylocopa sonorina]|uniref:transmembrane protein 45B n=1 Tax=Xylocopa sonorina TaxID=1818115 RepID=UPI00403A8475
MDSFTLCVFTGLIFYTFGLKWCYEYAKYWVGLRARDDAHASKRTRFIQNYRRFINGHPIEGGLKLIATAMGLIGTVTGGFQQDGSRSPKVVLATIYLFFAFSGLVDILNFYFPHNVSKGLVKLALAQSFFVEGFLFLGENNANTALFSILLAFTVWTTSLVIILELMWPEMKLVRASTTLLHGSWMTHMIFTPNDNRYITDQNTVALLFAWHIAAASAVTLCIVAATRSRAPKLIMEEPPEIPIYDYCQEPIQRM